MSNYNMKEKINFLGEKWKAKIGKDIPGIDKKYHGFEWMEELLREKENDRRTKRSK